MAIKTHLDLTKSDSKPSTSTSKNRGKQEFNPSCSTPYKKIMHLQQTIGNRAVGQLLSSGVLLAKLEIGRPNDKYEKEADRVADQVMSMSNPHGECMAESKEEKAHAKQIVWRNVEQDKEGPILKKRSDSNRPTVSPNLALRIEAFKGGGKPLSNEDRTFFERRFGTEFSQVKIHTGSQADRTARLINARAATLSQDIIFRAGQYRPGTSQGHRLIAHELTHVIQQRNGLNNNTNATKTLQRDDEITQLTITCEYAEALSDEDLLVQMRILYDFLLLPSYPEEEYQVAEANLSTLQQELMQTHRIIRVRLTSEDVVNYSDQYLDELIDVLYEYLLTSQREGGVLVGLAQSNFRLLEDEQRRRGAVQAREERRSRIRSIDWGSATYQHADESVVQGSVVVTLRDRMLYVMELLIEQYGFPIEGAAGLVGNVRHESRLVPNMVERLGSTQRRGLAQRPARPGQIGGGIGLMQWTERGRRRGLIEHEFQGRQLNWDILFNLDAQVDYMVQELQSTVFRPVCGNRGVNVNDVLRDHRVSVENATKVVFYGYARPASVDSCCELEARGRICTALRRRMQSAQEAMDLYTREQQLLQLPQPQTVMAVSP